MAIMFCEVASHLLTLPKTTTRRIFSTEVADTAVERSPIPLALVKTKMALTALISSSSQLIQLPMVHPSHYVSFMGYALIRSKFQLIALRDTGNSVFPVPSKVSSTVRFRCCAKSTEEKEADTLTSDNDDDFREETHRSSNDAEKVEGGGSRTNIPSLSDALNLGIREPVYEGVELVQVEWCQPEKFNR